MKSIKTIACWSSDGLDLDYVRSMPSTWFDEDCFMKNLLEPTWTRIVQVNDFVPTWRWLGVSVLVLSWVCVLMLAYFLIISGMVHHSWGVKRFTNIFIKTSFKKNSLNWFLLKKIFQSIEFLKQSIEWDRYFYYYWNLWLSQLTVNSVYWMVCSINWTSDS